MDKHQIEQVREVNVGLLTRELDMFIPEAIRPDRFTKFKVADMTLDVSNMKLNDIPVTVFLQFVE
jgi:hypothetical protein